MAAIFLRRASSTSTPILHESLFVSHLALCRGLCFYNSNSIIFLTLRKALSVQCIFQPWKSYSLYYKSAKFGWILKVFKRSQKNEINLVKTKSSQNNNHPSFYRWWRRRGRFTSFIQLGSTAAHFPGSFREDWKNASKMPKNPS